MDWHTLTSNEVLKDLESSRDGLSSREAQSRLERYGENRLEEKKRTTPLEIFVGQFQNVLILILLVAATLSFAIGEIADSLTILAIVILNSVLGFYQEYRAEKAIEALKKMLSLKAKVIRDGRVSEIDSRYIVPGDVVILEIGEKVPADIYLLEGNTLQIDEASLTGESIPVSKATGHLPRETTLAEMNNMAFMGTAITNGHGLGVVVATGMETQFGNIAKLTQEIKEEETPLKRRLDILGRRIGEISLAIAVIVGIVGIMQERGFMEMLLVGISLAVAVIPEGLPAVVTLTLALGIKNLVKRNCLIRHLMASETLGATSVVCTDKTGTLTKNEMTVREIYTPMGVFQVSGEGYEPTGNFLKSGEAMDPKEDTGLRTLLETGLLCNHAFLEKTETVWQVLGAPTEGSLVVAANKGKIFKRDISEADHPAVTEFSFTSERKRMTVIYHGEDRNTAYIKGAPEVILERSSGVFEDSEIVPLSPEKRTNIFRTYEGMAERGLRTLALAYKDMPAEMKKFNADEVEQDLVFLGVVGILDPPRPEVKEALETTKNAKIDVIMMTGDSPLTAKAVADQIGLDSMRVVRGRDLDAMDDSELREVLKDTTVFARVNPQHKLRVVELLQEGGHITAMTGDGVNDAPALKKSNIGISMGIKGTDVAREASDMILVDDNFASIVAGVEEGRRQYDNIQKFTRYLFSSNIGEIIAIGGALYLGLPLILLPVQILWMNLITDGMTALALGMEPMEKDIMKRRPRDPEKAILSRHAFLVVLLIGIWIGGATLYTFASHLGTTMDLDKARTMAFVGIVIFEKVNVFNFRSFRHTLRSMGFFSNPYLIIAWLATVSLQVMAVYNPFLQGVLHTVPLAFSDWLLLFALGLPLIIAGETYKRLRYSPHIIRP